MLRSDFQIPAVREPDPCDTHDGLADPSTENTICFKVVKRNPSNWHTVAVSAAAGSKLKSTDIVISQHRLYPTAGGQAGGAFACVMSPMFAQDPISLLRDLDAIPIDVLETTLRVWEASEAATVALPGVHADAVSVSDAVGRLISAHAIQDLAGESSSILQLGPSTYDIGLAGTLALLQHAGFAEQARDAEGNAGWRLSRHGLESLE